MLKLFTIRKRVTGMRGLTRALSMRILAALLALGVSLLYPADVCYKSDDNPDLDDIVDAVLGDDDLPQLPSADAQICRVELPGNAPVPSFPDMEKVLLENRYQWRISPQPILLLDRHREDAEIQPQPLSLTTRAPPLA